MKKILSFLLSLSVFLGLSFPAGTVLAADGKIELNTSAAAYDDYFMPLVVSDSGVSQRGSSVDTAYDDGTLLVDVSSLEGADVSVSISDGSAVINTEQHSLTLIADADIALVDGERKPLNCDAVEMNGTVYAPVCNIASACGLTQIFENGEIVYAKPFQTLRLFVDANGSLPSVGETDKYKDESGNTVLTFSSQQETESAYYQLKNEPSVDSVIWENIYYALGNTDESENNEPLSWGAEYIGSPYVVNYAETLSKRSTVTVAVIDTGVDTDHPFLADRLSDKMQSNVEDIVGHGTHCAGIVANNTPDNVKILPVKGLTTKTGAGTDSDLATAVNYAVSCKADVISMSFGGIDIGYSLLKEAIKNAYNAGCILVAAAGNESDRASRHYPANSSYCITVGATDKNGRPANFSNFGASVDVSAPGVSINSSYLNGEYKLMSGTSMATPFVAAACATDITINGKKSCSAEYAAITGSVSRFNTTSSSSIYTYGTGIISYYGYLDREMVKPVNFSVPSGSYDSLFSVSLTCATPNAKIYYLQSSDESVASELPSPQNGSLYSKPIVISGDTTIVAAAYCDGKLRSEKSVATYILNAFDEDETYLVDNNGCLTGYTGDLKILSVPEYVGGIRVTSVGKSAFENSDMVSVNLPDSVTVLGEKAFRNCRSLEHVTAAGVTEIPDYCFYIDNKLSSLKLGTLVSIGNYAFNSCSLINEDNLDLSSVESVGNYGLYKTGFNRLEIYNIQHFGEYSFSNCSSLVSVVLPNVKIVQSKAFRDCANLASVRLDNALQLDDAAFAFCNNLSDFYAPALQVVGDSVFNGCISLTSVDFQNLQQIGAQAFSGTGFSEISLPGASQIGAQAFSNCKSLTDVDMPAQVYIPSGLFFGCSALTDIPECFENAREVGRNAFKDCTSLESVNLPKAEIINQDAFIGATAINEINLPSAITVYRQQIDSPAITSLGLPSAEVINGFTSDYLQSVDAPSAWVLSGTPNCPNLAQINAPLLIENIDNPYQNDDITPDGRIVLKDADITVSNCTYNPFAERTVPQYSVYSNGVLLAENEDYTITFANNNACCPSFANSYYKVEGIGNYAGTVTGRFTIGSYSVNNLTVVPIDNQNYTGKLVMPAVQLADVNGNVLTDGFYVKYADNYNPGTATLSVTGLNRNGYTTDLSSVSGTNSADFRIIVSADDVDAYLDSDTYKFSGSKICPKPTVVFNSKTLVENVDYALSYGDNNSEGKGFVYIDFINEYYTGTKTLEFNIVMPLNGWVNQGGVMYYYKDDELQTEMLVKYNGCWYYADDNGAMFKGWKKFGSNMRYFKPDGVMATGLTKATNGNWYYFNNSGIRQYGLQKFGSNWRYFQTNGVMAVGWVKFGSNYRYFASNGIMSTGLTKASNGKWYYFNSSGIRQYGWIQFGKNWRYFGSNGVMLANTSKKISGKTYKFNSSGICTNK